MASSKAKLPLNRNKFPERFGYERKEILPKRAASLPKAFGGLYKRGLMRYDNEFPDSETNFLIDIPAYMFLLT